jgi:hypothetical protein
MDRHEIVKLFDSLNNRGGKNQRYISSENFKGFIKKQNDQYDDSFEMDSLIRKYTQHDEYSKAKGLIFNLLIKFFNL